MLIGYARVSTQDQDTGVQVNALTAHGCEKIFKENISATHKNRPQLEAALEFLREGDILVFYKLDRLARSMKDLLRILSLLESKSASLRCLTQPVDTSTPAGVMMLNMLGAVSQFERDLNSARTKDALALRKERGQALGRKPCLNPDQQQQVRQLHKRGRSQADIARLLNVSPSTIHRVIKG